MNEPRLMKDRINRIAVQHIAASIAQAMPEFDQQSFYRDSMQSLHTLELKQRVKHIIHTLHRYLPEDFAETSLVLQRLKQYWQADKNQAGWSSFSAWPVIDYVGVYGIDHPHIALPLLKELTPLFSAEFAIRPFLLKHFEITYGYLQQWCHDDNEHVRRLVSEGSRPRLPWGLRLHNLCKDPAPILPLLEQLKNDSSMYVRKSVANNLNDITKDNADIALLTCKTWQKNASAETLWIIRHASRSLIKAGHPEALDLLGYTPSPAIKTSHLLLENHALTLGDNLCFSFNVESTSRHPQRLVIDYAIHHIKANGSCTAKVFKLKSLTLDTKSSVTVQKKHPFKKITTRQYYSGIHKIEILVNGKTCCTADFCLTV